MAGADAVVPSGQIAEFLNAANAVGAVGSRVHGKPEAVAAALQEATEGARSIVIAEAEHVDPSLLEAFPKSLVLQNPGDEELATADVGITDAFAGVASTGSVCVNIGKSLTAAASLLMPLHIVLLPAERIVSRPRDLFHFGGAGLNSSFVFITGPSATADMGPLVRGVHGPHRLRILVVES